MSAAAEVFADRGADASVDDIARRAGVGVGTIYRHFASRDALYVAVHRSEIETIARRGGEIAAAHPPGVALRLWLEELLTFFFAKRDMAEVFGSIVATGANPFQDLRVQVYEAGRRLIEAAATDGIRQDVDITDVLAALHGISLAANDSHQATRLADLVMDGLCS